MTHRERNPQRIVALLFGITLSMAVACSNSGETPSSPTVTAGDRSAVEQSTTIAADDSPAGSSIISASEYTLEFPDEIRRGEVFEARISGGVEHATSRIVRMFDVEDGERFAIADILTPLSKESPSFLPLGHDVDVVERSLPRNPIGLMLPWDLAPGEYQLCALRFPTPSTVEPTEVCGSLLVSADGDVETAG